MSKAAGVSDAEHPKSNFETIIDNPIKKCERLGKRPSAGMGGHEC